LSEENTAGEEAAPRPSPEYLNTEKIALRLIARAEQCSAGLARKLEKRGCDAICVNEVISHLTEIRLLDDSRFARLWLESRLRFARSPRRLQASLCTRGIDRDEADAALKTILDEDAENAMLGRFVKKYARKLGGGKEEGGRTLKYVLKSEGFSQAAIQKFLEE